MALQPRDHLLVRYRGGAERHARIVLAPLDGQEYYIVAPDADIYAETRFLKQRD